MGEAWHSEETVINRYINLHPVYETLRTDLAKQGKQPQTTTHSLKYERHTHTVM